MPEPDDTLRSIDATVEMWERRSDAMAWRSDAVAAIDHSGLPLTSENPKGDHT
ncbi:hypothetical protein Q7689_00620 [Nocardiopsis tropica]|uniref:hypothetical protein n=1 Tax=Nocardiopsis tropica TaxID=109330 RepID=UPI002E86CFB3|nr:hypothetical protein [Nocardiopsis tropica]